MKYRVCVITQRNETENLLADGPTKIAVERELEGKGYTVISMIPLSPTSEDHRGDSDRMRETGDTVPSKIEESLSRELSVAQGLTTSGIRDTAPVGLVLIPFIAICMIAVNGKFAPGMLVVMGVMYIMGYTYYLSWHIDSKYDDLLHLIGRIQHDGFDVAIGIAGHLYAINGGSFPKSGDCLWRIPTDLTNKGGRTAFAKCYEFSKRERERILSACIQHRQGNETGLRSNQPPVDPRRGFESD